MHIIEFFIFITAALVSNWIWQLHLDRREGKRQQANAIKNFLAKVHHCIHELQYNATPGIGGPRSPFRLTALDQLLQSTEVSLLGEELTNSLKQLMIEAGVSNGAYSLTGPGKTKSMSNLLILSLQKRSEELKTHPWVGKIC